jgi:hypothetical protein
LQKSQDRCASPFPGEPARVNGAGWKGALPPGPNGAGSYLIGVSCRSATSCVAVGSEQGARASVAYSDVLSGTTWVGRTVPIPKGTLLSQLESVSCPSATFCVAVGYAVSNAGAISVLMDRWNGNAWSAMKPAALPAGFHGHVLAGVSCASPTSCVAVGSAGLNPVSNYPTGRAAAAVWNGRTWQARSVPAPAKGKFSLFYGVYCQKSFCAAVGQTGPSGTPRGTSLTGFSTGSSWKLVAAR